MNGRPMKVLITAIGSFSAEAVISSLRAMNTTLIVGCNSTPAEWIYTSKKVDRFYFIKEAKNELEYINALRSICLENFIDYIVPLTDIEIDALIKNVETFEKINTKICMPPNETISIARNKMALYEKFKDDKITIPIKTETLALTKEHVLQTPSIIKPINGRSSQGIIRIDRIEDFTFYKTKLDLKRNIIQPLLEGDIWVADITRSAKENKTIIVCRKELIRTCNGAGMTVSVEKNLSIYKSAKNIAEKLRLNGCINVEFIMYNDIPYLMDINPRFSAGIAFSKMAGVDMIKNSMHCFNETNLEKAIVTPMVISKYHQESIMTPST